MIRLIVAGVSYCVSLILICHCLLTCPIFTLLPSVFFILKAHRDFSLNVICAIQAWFIIIIIIIIYFRVFTSLPLSKFPWRTRQLHPNSNRWRL